VFPTQSNELSWTGRTSSNGSRLSVAGSERRESGEAIAYLRHQHTRAAATAPVGGAKKAAPMSRWQLSCRSIKSSFEGQVTGEAKLTTTGDAQ
jgi:hypothetical protein